MFNLQASDTSEEKSRINTEMITEIKDKTKVSTDMLKQILDKVNTFLSQVKFYCWEVLYDVKLLDNVEKKHSANGWILKINEDYLQGNKDWDKEHEITSDYIILCGTDGIQFAAQKSIFINNSNAPSLRFVNNLIKFSNENDSVVQLKLPIISDHKVLEGYLSSLMNIYKLYEKEGILSEYYITVKRLLYALFKDVETDQDNQMNIL